MLEHFGNRQPVVDIPVQHLADEVDAGFGKGQKGDAEGVVEDLVDVVERVLLIDNGVEEDAERPDVLFLAAIGFALQNLGGCVI